MKSALPSQHQQESNPLPIEGILALSAIASVSLTILLAGSLPRSIKTFGLFTGFLSSSALVAIEFFGKDWRKYRQAQLEMEHLQIQDHLNSVDTNNQAIAQMRQAIELRDRITRTASIETWEYWFAQYGLTAIALPQIGAAREAMGMTPQAPLELEAEVIQTPNVHQEPIGDMVAKMVEDQLDVSWFQSWSKRSGIVCGESGDGKSFLLSNIVLFDFLKTYTDADNNLHAEVYICDPDFGSSHEGEEPNTWLDLPLDKSVFTEIDDIVDVIIQLSRTVDERVNQTKQAVKNNQPKPIFTPILLIVDEEPMVVSRLTGDRLALVVQAIINILDRGLKQNVTFKMGTQTLAVGGEGRGGTRLPMDSIRKLEAVILSRAARSDANYKNLNIPSEDVQTVLTQIKPLPRRVGDKFVCVTYLEKELRIKAIPLVKKVKVADKVNTANQSASIDPTEPELENKLKAYKSVQEFYQDLSDRLPAQFTDTEIISLYIELSEARVRQEDWENLVRLLTDEVRKIRDGK